MNLQQLRTFVVIAHEGSLTRASEKLCLSQPAVSAQIKNFEEELDVKLFDRTPRGMVLTPEGKVLLGEADKALIAANNVSSIARRLQDGSISGEFKLGTIADPSVLRLGELLSALIARHPDLKLSLSQSISGDIIERVIQRRIHAGYLIGEAEHSELGCIEISPITLRIVVPMALKEKTSGANWQDIAKLPWLSTPEGCSFRKIASKMFSRHGVQPQIVIEADQETTLINLVTTGVGLTLLREDVALAAEAAGKLVVWSPGAEVSRLNLIYLRERLEEPVMQAILSLIAEIWRLPWQKDRAA
jgi:DNA-binding transcriptional LysR family regulator